jgi:hypothetical protein
MAASSLHASVLYFVQNLKADDLVKVRNNGFMKKDQ